VKTAIITFALQELVYYNRGTQEDLIADQNVQGKRSSSHESVNIDAEESGSVSKAVHLRTMLQKKENVIKELKAKLEESQIAFKELEEMAVYKTES
jgi:hypothetical protein